MNSGNISASQKLILDVKDLETNIFTPRGVIKAVDRVSFRLFEGRTLGIVGETGSGKSMTAYSILKLLPAKTISVVGGTVTYFLKNGTEINISKMKSESKKMRELRGKELAMIFQDSLSSLNPVYTIGFQIIENIIYNKNITRKDARALALDLVKKVGISAPKKRIKQFPHELSGGMRQRALIALALSANPRVLIADEPTTALDVTIQAQILKLIKSVQENNEMGLMIITHDMGVIAENADDVAVMYLGSIVEYGNVYSLFAHPKHPYTVKLLESIIQLGSKNRILKPIEGTIPEPIDLNPGCKFYSRCQKKKDGCEFEEPPTVEAEKGHWVKCWLFSE